jgi:hypothetical protein
MAERTHEDGQPLTRVQLQTERGSQGDKDKADGDGPLTTAEVSPAENQARADQVPLRASATTNPSEQSQVKHPDQQRQDVSPNELREQAERDAAKARPKK